MSRQAPAHRRIFQIALRQVVRVYVFVHKKSFLSVVLGTSVAWTAAAQDAKTILNNAAKAMGVDDVASVQYSGGGVMYAFGQAFSPNSPWPKFNLKSFTRVDDYNAGASRQTVVRTQAENPPRGGGLQPVIGEQTLSQVIGYKQPWADQMEIWISPVGFLKAAHSNNATVKPETLDGKKYNVVSFMAQGKYSVDGCINDQNLIAKVDAWVDNPLLGDTPVEVSYAEYKDFGGFFGPLKFPTKIVEKQGGYPVIDLNITEAKRNVIAAVHTPEPSDPSGVVVDEALIDTGIYYFTGGTHHSVVVEFNEYLVVIEAPLDEARSAAVISEAKKLFLNKPIRYLINTHQHFDHSGGIRAYAAEGAIILTYQTNKPYYEKAFARPHTLP
jgi:hypothetical protein